MVFIGLALLIAWVNLAPDEDVYVEKNIEEVPNNKSAKEYIKIAWDHWTRGGGFFDEAYEKNLTFIALRSIDAHEMAALGMGKEFSDLQKLASNFSGNLGKLSVEEKEMYDEDFRAKLEEIHNALN